MKKIKTNKKIKRKVYSNQKGITLVALVVTIVVLLILAGVSVNALFGNGGIIKKAQEAQNTMDKATQNDLEGINELNNWIKDNIETKEIVTKTFNVTNIDGDILWTYTVEEGMTWEKWIGSRYNTDGWKISSDLSNAVIDKNSTITDGSCIIVEDNLEKYFPDIEDVEKYGVKATDVINLENYIYRGYVD